MEYLKMGISDKKYENCSRLLEITGKLFKDYKGKEDSWQKSIFAKTYGHFMQFLEHNKNIKVKNDKIRPATLSNQLNVFISKAEGDIIDDMKNDY
jgi:hypothetical protein